MRHLLVAAALLLAGCASRPEVVTVTPPPVVATAMPQPPVGIAASFRLPPRAATGGWQTPNRALSPAATLWHLRAGLNVAALGCRDAGEPARVAAYNGLIARHAAAFAAAHRTLTAEDRTAYGTGWQAAQDDAMTRLYNFWAQPFAGPAFCAAADAVLAEAALPDAQMTALAPVALARLEAPFLAFYDRFAAYQVALAAWRAGTTPPIQLAAAAPPIAVDPTALTDTALAH